MYSALFKFILLIIIHGVVLGKPPRHTPFRYTQYSDKYDNIDLDQILRNDRLMKNYIYCLLEKGRCTRDGAELKRLIGDALVSGCSRCNDKQKSGTKKVIRHLIVNKPGWWNELEAKYDPQGMYKRKYQEELQKEGFVQYHY